jgi:hypothetical protein
MVILTMEKRFILAAIAGGALGLENGLGRTP